MPVPIRSVPGNRLLCRRFLRLEQRASSLWRLISFLEEKHMPKPIYIHYGSSYFDPDKFCAVQNQIIFSKPIGGLWGSRKNDPFGWKAWCKSSQYAECEEDNSFEFTMKDDNRVYRINAIADLENLPQLDPFKELPEIGSLKTYFIDFETCLKKGYDAIELCWFGQRANPESMFMRGHALLGWDCNSILVLNPDAVVPYTSQKTHVVVMPKKHNVPKDI